MRKLAIVPLHMAQWLHGDGWRVLFAAALSCVLLALSWGSAAQRQLSENVLRLHILANSDSVQDQTLKMQVRDALLLQAPQLFQNANSIEEAKIQAAQALPQLEELCEQEMRRHGVDAQAHASLEYTYFTTRDYDGFSLPAGYYDAIRIRLGEGQGENWWCVMYPPLCLSTATTVTEDAKEICLQYDIQTEEIQLMTAKQDGSTAVQVKFQLAEWCSEGLHALHSLLECATGSSAQASSP